MSKNKSAKYKIINTDITNDIAKKIVGKQVTVEKVKANGGPGSYGGKKPSKQRKAPSWFIEFRDEQREFNKSVMQRFDEQAKFNKSIREDLNRVIKLNNLKH